jgi:hypothetical protein
MLLSRQEIDDSQILVVANGSFLLNASLVNHEHRKLAGKLIEQVGKPNAQVVFLESRHDGPRIHDADPAAKTATTLSVFQVWPTNWILLHLAAVGIIFCFSRFLVFGRSRATEPPGTSDFGKHVDAVATLLRQSRDAAYARSRMQHYQQTVKRVE